MSASCPIKFICVGISPYENGILPDFASALAYSMGLFSGLTLLVQVMLQLLTICAMWLDRKFFSTRLHVDEKAKLTSYAYNEKFVQTLRCLLMCLGAGAMFVNAVPLLEIVMIYGNNGHKFRILSMSEVADKCLSDSTRSCPPPMTAHIEVIRGRSPAIVLRLNVSKTKGLCLVSDDFMEMSKLLGRNLEWDPVVTYGYRVLLSSLVKKLRKMLPYMSNVEDIVENFLRTIDFKDKLSIIEMGEQLAEALNTGDAEIVSFCSLFDN
ncbi:uncharacterized protein LY79DRAFT_675444 [Colletotrichum navitas]|uniref:Uncharacterized protein n=1 Tax=Colletotrichum navitas TaxID=681940 RepID=A0AAD8PIR9_9PEZI|nr:uncharacterized protein LY79DRAFT_675444 [Colletotrichum navitas]KAK1561578.1 hypothetical protein LY79DRAFT_675444 [Colletotrichum navitas]